MSQRGQHSDRITEEAALWFVRAQDSTFSKDDRVELASWLAGSAENVREYISLVTITQDIRELSITPSADELVALAREAADNDNVVALLNPAIISSNQGMDSEMSTAKPPTKLRRRFVRWAAAASLMAVVAASVYYLEITPRPIVYSTGVGEQVSFPLDDGSLVTLNARSELRVAYTEDERNIHLIAGEVLFDVAKDSERPFQVITDRATIVAVGTAFNVRHRGAGTAVTVVEGTIEIRSNDSKTGQGVSPPLPALSRDVVPIRVTVGQQAIVASGQVAVLDTNVKNATSWRERRLVFASWALSDVVAEFNLYNDRRIIIDDEQLAGRSISGAFDADDRESFALFMSEAGLAESETQVDGTIVLRAKDDTP